MKDDNRPPRDEGTEPDEPLAELADLRVEPDSKLAGRVQRDINRRTLVADSLDFSLNVMLQIFWEHLRRALDTIPGTRPQDPDPDEPDSQPKQGDD